MHAMHLTLDTGIPSPRLPGAGRDLCRDMGNGPLFPAEGRLRRCDVICGAIFELVHCRPVNRPIASEY